MTDKDIVKLAAQLTQSLVTKDDIKEVKDDVKEVRDNVKRLERKIDNIDVKLGRKIDELDKKADEILGFAEEVDETTTDHEKRLKALEAVSVIAHQIKR